MSVKRIFPKHTAEVTVTDQGVPPKSAVVRVIVKVRDENDNKPQFLEKIYKIQLPEREKAERERAAKREPVYRVIASDRDEGPNAEISYSIEEGDEHGKFFIEPKTGLVSSKKFSTAGDYDILTIKAVDNGRPQRSASCRLHIEWIPKPKLSSKPLNFDELSFSFSVMESDPVSHMVGIITTEHTDSPVWFHITGDIQAKEMFHIVQMACDLNCTSEGGNYDSRFEVDKGSGTVIVARPLDAEQISNYNLTVEATDGTNSISTKVFIRVIDTNNHRPQFSQPKYEINIPEDTAPETEILQISATDEDEKNKMTYTLLSSTDPFSLRKFRLDPGTGLLYTAEKLDHETIHRHTLTVMVRDQDIPVKRNLARVIINVEDTNDNAPRFTSSSYSAHAFESAAVGSAVLQITALDKDKGRNAEILYSIESGNVANSFAIDPVLGTITVAKELDRSSRSQFELAVKASDKGLPPLSMLTTVHITVTVSDNAKPKFTEREFSAEISETATVGSFVSAVTASSQSSVFYQIKDGNTNGAFDINPSSGVVTTQRTLDYETLRSYKLIVQATNMAGMLSNTTLLINLKDENDNAPVFTQAEFTGMVSESAPFNSVVLTNDKSPLVIRASDADRDMNARLVYQIVELFAHNYFEIDSSTGAIRTIASLDYEQRSSFQFTVQVHDMGRPRLFAEMAANVTVQVIDVNDCSPKFSRDTYEASIIVPAYKGVKVITVNATDADTGTNSKLLFSISNGNIGGKFQIDPISGAIFIENTTQLHSRYELTVRVSDGRFVSSTAVNINVRENTNSTLKFNRGSYIASVPENSSEKRTLAVVAVIGSPINEPLFYTILNPNKRFTIGRTSGVLSTTGLPFDREEQDTYDVVVEVAKEEKSSGFSHVLVKVTIEDVNDNKPMFVNLPYHTTLVQRDAAVGQSLRQVTAVDGDVGRNAEFHYHLREHHEYFQISLSGEIFLIKPFEQETQISEFVINVVAKDRGEPPLSSMIEVPITVVDKAMPVFEKPFYSIEIPENIQLHTPIVHVQANGSEGPRIVYSITEGDPFSQFSINFNTGVLYVIQLLDFETHPAYKLNVGATDSLTGAHSEVFVDIILEDVNDNSPAFKSTAYAASLSEASVIGTSVLQVTATDSDSGNNKELFYQLVQDEGQSFDCFGIDRDSGVIWTACALDHEETAQHKLVVRAVDGGVPPLSSDVSVLIDVTDLNDNAPVFTQRVYEVRVSELASSGHFVTIVQASDVDSSDVGKLEYSLLSGKEDQDFVIDAKSGQIAISSRRRPQMEPLYNLNVSASDGVFRATATVRVTVVGANFHGPAFAQIDYVVELSENSHVGTLVTEIKATDKDPGIYGRVTYHIVNDFAKEKFSVNEDGQIFTLERVDREKPIEKVMPISLMAKDGGGRVAFCTINVILTDVNDNAPQFRAAEYRVNVASDIPRGTTVVKISASDMDEGTNADITYFIEGGEKIEENFEINPYNGVIITKESIIGLENDLCAFYVRARDSGNPSRQSVVPVSVEVLAPEVPVPKFVEPHYRFAVAEDLPIGSEIDVIQAESEQAVVYSLIKGNTPESNQNEVFLVDRETGKLKLGKKLDYETTKWYLLTLLAQSNYKGSDIMSTVDVNIQIKDVNDNRPQFESDPYEAFVTENLPRGTLVIPVKATDLDTNTNGQVIYSLDPNQETEEIAELFAINSETGWITTLKELDRERQSKYIVGVMASDRGEKVQLVTSTTVRVTVADVNDSPPRFTAEIYKGTVSEDDPPPSGVVAILSTTDADSEDINKQVSYYITGGDPLGQFAIEHIQKDWKVSVRKPLDREERDNYLLNITATDGTFVAKAVVEVKVLDANDNSPVCEKVLYAETVPEDAPAGKLILQVSATDADIRSNAEISYKLIGAGSDQFSIDPDTGELRTVLTLDREERDVYNLKVRALDGGSRYCEAAVEITVEDVNDNVPQFVADTVPLTVFENTEIRTVVARLQANDADLGSNSNVLYSFVDSADGQFSIDKRSGIVSLEKPLDREVQAVYMLQVRATDQGVPRRLSSICTVVVSVLDINDNPPVFERREYVATVPEDVRVGTQVLRVFAASKDAESNAEISYVVVSGNELGMFSIDSRMGDIFVIEGLDYETTREYYLTIEATDGGTPSLSDMATVNINVTDVNDNSPVFSQNVYAAVVSEDSDLGKSIVNVMARDADGPSSNHVHYSIVNGNQGSPFTIDAVKGEVKVARQLDREKVSGYTLTVLASDNGNPPKSSSATINIDVSDVNDNPPVFSQANYSLIIQENRPEWTSVLLLGVTDGDASHNGPPFSFTIVGGNEGNAFQINQQGAILTAMRLDQKTTEHYMLHVQVADSGKPPLASSTFISIRVIEESVYPPAVLPLDVFVTTQGEEYPGGVLGKVHATDQDIYDMLTYSLSPEPFGPFSLSATDGKLVARRGLDEGHYPLNVTVTDGRFTAGAGINVHVRRITQRMLNGSIAVRFANVAPEEFVGDYWRNFLRALRNVAAVLEDRRAGGQRAAVLFYKLNSSVDAIEEMTGLHIARVIDKLCAGLECPRGYCDEVITLDNSAMSTHSTARLSFVTPRHHRAAVCLCKGSKCPVLNTVCEGDPCPEGSVCISSQKEAKYSCVCTDGKVGTCSGGPSLTFSGNGYVKYRLMENENKEEMKLSLKLRTFSSHAILMYARGTDYSILEIHNGRLQYKFDCGSGPGLVSVHSIQLNDGEWHTVSLEVDGNYAKLVLDQDHAASGMAPGTLRTLNLDDTVYFGGHAREHTARRGRSPPIANGFRGCMEALVLNGQELPLSAKPRPHAHAHAVMEDMAEVSPGCTMAPALGCSSNPCTNGGTCSSLPSGGYFCKCGALFMGTHCEISISPCASNPCLYGGTCVPHRGDFYCQCRGQYSGQRCQLGPYCKDNPCKNSGKCIDSLDGPVCECEQGFQGERCLSDIDECANNPCANGGQCENTYGSYSCNCSLAFRGKLCELKSEIRNKFISTSWNIGLEEIIGIVVFVLSIFILALFFVLIRKGCCHSSKSKAEEDKHGPSNAFFHGPYLDPKLSKNIYSDVPPQVPVRPISYTPSVPSDSRNNLDRNSFEGSIIPEHPEFSTFNPDSVHGHRKAVAVCSVAPNLPPPPPSDSDSIQKPSWDYEYDVVELDPCLNKKAIEDACRRVSGVHSLSSFHPEAYDENESLVALALKNPRGYHWDTSDWMPSVHLPGIQEFPSYDALDSPAPLYIDPNVLDADYYPGGYDIDSDTLPPPNDFPLHDELPPLPEQGDQYGTLEPPRDTSPLASPSSSTRSQQQLYALPPYQYTTHLAQPRDPATGTKGHVRFPAHPPGRGRDLEARNVDSASLSMGASAASCSDVSDVMLSDYESGDEGRCGRATAPASAPAPDTTQHTEV
ncbi:hypothetical protein AAFF_G00358090 [Aldrovandia affinis]|uniref:Protocadherin Fat 1 n=1 Tax=Aldrovandia affinis TaxID=143900 RepID=A0AAD7T8U3_9TELE|nr:hypothetical protein AAFF_G00358090 [Aldrovandia affinis]